MGGNEAGEGEHSKVQEIIHQQNMDLKFGIPVGTEEQETEHCISSKNVIMIYHLVQSG